jgi:hypothetical protein
LENEADTARARRAAVEEAVGRQELAVAEAQGRILGTLTHFLADELRRSGSGIPHQIAVNLNLALDAFLRYLQVAPCGGYEDASRAQAKGKQKKGAK